MLSMSESFEEVLDRYGELTYTNKGISMLPMLRPERDVFTVARIDDRRLKENDVILFKRNGRYILHRIVEVYDDHYTTMGDNCITCEENIRDEEILGVLTGFQRDGRGFDINDRSYRLYIRWIRSTEKGRIVLKKVLAKTKRMIKSLLMR